MKNMNHEEYPKSLRGKTESELRWIMKDAGEAAEAMPQGENAGYYADEVLYCAAELTRRKNKGAGEYDYLTEKVRRFEVIDRTGRVLVEQDIECVLSFQDSGGTLKVFVTPRDGGK